MYNNEENDTPHAPEFSEDELSTIASSLLNGEIANNPNTIDAVVVDAGDTTADTKPYQEEIKYENDDEDIDYDEIRFNFEEDLNFQQATSDLKDTQQKEVQKIDKIDEEILSKAKIEEIEQAKEKELTKEALDYVAEMYYDVKQDEILNTQKPILELLAFMKNVNDDNKKNYEAKLEQAKEQIKKAKEEIEYIFKEKSELENEITKLKEQLQEQKKPLRPTQQDENIEELEPLQQQDEEPMVQENENQEVPIDDFDEMLDDTEDDDFDIEDAPKSKKNNFKAKLIGASIILAIVSAGAYYVYSNYKASMIEKRATQGTATPKVNTIHKKTYQGVKTPMPKAQKMIESKHQNAKPQVKATVPTPNSKVPIPKPKVAIDYQDDEILDSDPSERELYGIDNKVNADVAYSCRLRGKYRPALYGYFVKNAQGDFVINPKKQGIYINERAVVYNYSKDSKFVKVEDGKFVKSKLFSGCRIIK